MLIFSPFFPIQLNFLGSSSPPPPIFLPIQAGEDRERLEPLLMRFYLRI